MRRRCVNAEGAALMLAALASGTPLGGCTVDKARYMDDVYACDVREPDPALECGEGYVCHPGSQIGTFDFCAPACTPGGEEEYCAPDGALLPVCSPSAPACGEGLSCLRTSVTSDEGLCLPVEVCGEDDECRDPVRNQCLSRILAQGYGAVLDPSLLTNLWCLQGDCSEFSPCEAGYSCLGGVPTLARVAPICVPNCVRNPRGDARSADLCPRSFVCASTVLSSLPYRFCLPGLFGFPCETDDQCLIGTCEPMGSHARACTVPCTADAECLALYRPAVGERNSVACLGGRCITAFSVYMQLFCDPGDNRCPDGAACSATVSAADGGVPGETTGGEAYCSKPCSSPADCKASGSATSCLHLGSASTCMPGLPSPLVECDPADADSCVKDLECRKPATGTPYCTIPCTSDAQCQSHPWLGPAWHCRGPAGNQLCTTP